MRPMKDPAPSRMAYRMNRLMLTPRFRLFLRYGLPVLLIVAGVSIWASDEARRDALAERVAELRRQVEERPEFMVRMMVVETGSPEIEAEVRDILPVDFPVSSFDLELDTLREAVEEIDAVASASVQIRGGGVLAVTVVERVPVAVWRRATGLVLVDAEGHRVQPLDARADRLDLPLILGAGAGAEVAEALEIIEAAAPVTERFRALRRMGERRWDVLLDRDQIIMLPEDDAVTAMKRVMALDHAQDLLARDIVAIDFRNPRRPVLRLSDAAMQENLTTRTRVYEAVVE
ncbi:cell division protein FtsQ [Alphaproteobacteria bacterium GH1-50]|uniref:Cell division protein FtsQ n=1 Tax=Kangsaoukella pontilimi TaxID=2691042 RepID=A0A7C9IFE3_9RHOB|nr:cell division protein FtsQ/DivIB [Kangsaoukella pontilimi]MXQ07504.1 cell division protein FtsQ [Kangsaoukella pontilimi]